MDSLHVHWENICENRLKWLYYSLRGGNSLMAFLSGLVHKSMIFSNPFSHVHLETWTFTSRAARVGQFQSNGGRVRWFHRFLDVFGPSTGNWTESPSQLDYCSP